MTVSIMTAGLDDSFVDRLGKRFAPPAFKISNTRWSTAHFKSLFANHVSLVILGTQRQGAEKALSALQRIRSTDSRLPVLLIAQSGSEALAVSAFRTGASDYFNWPVSFDRLFERINHLLFGHLAGDAAEDIASGRREIMIGESRQLKSIKKYLTRVAASRSTLLITGETGTGKELAAAMVHRHSDRRNGPFVCVNCAALPDSLVESELYGYNRGAFTGAVVSRKGKFEMAHGGTLFLDEIGEMSAFSQAKILRSLEERCIYPIGADRSVPVDVRIVAATNQEPESLVKRGQFRNDLYYRLNVASVRLPPLRERKEDIPKLVSKSLDDLNGEYHRGVQGLSASAMATILRHEWPGNVRELKNTIEAAYIQCDAARIRYADLPQTFTKQLVYKDDETVGVREKLLLTLSETNWNKSETAKRLKWSRMRVYRTLQRYNLETVKA